MTGIQIILLLFILLILARLIRRYKAKFIDTRLFVWWFVFWIIAGVAVLWPEILNRLADILGVGRGADVAIYIAVVLIFFIIFKLYSRTVKIEKDIVKIVRSIALNNKNEESKDGD